MFTFPSIPLHLSRDSSSFVPSFLSLVILSRPSHSPSFTPLSRHFHALFMPLSYPLQSSPFSISPLRISPKNARYAIPFLRTILLHLQFTHEPVRFALPYPLHAHSSLLSSFILNLSINLLALLCVAAFLNPAYPPPLPWLLLLSLWVTPLPPFLSFPPSPNPFM